MTGIPSYSTTASENINANTGINWDEGMPPAAVNNSARQNMADIRASWNDASWFQYGIGSKTVAPVYASGTSFTLAGADATAYWHKGRRVKAVGSGTGTIYGTVTSSSFATSTTTVNVRWDSGSLSNESLTIYASTIPSTGHPLPAGTATNDDAAAGLIGEVASATAALSNSTLTTATGADILTLSLSAGDWDVCGNLYFTIGASTVVTQILAWLNDASATAPSLPDDGYSETNANITAPGVPIVETLSVGMKRFSLASTTTIYLSCQSAFTVDTLKAGGRIFARRVR